MTVAGIPDPRLPSCRTQFETYGRHEQRLTRAQISENVSLYCSLSLHQPHVQFRSVLYQLLMQGTLPLCAMLPSEASPTPPDGTTTLVDLEGVSFSLIWSLRSHLQQASVLANANFPETMGITFVVNAPSFFSTIWGWLKVRYCVHFFDLIFSPRLDGFIIGLV